MGLGYYQGSFVEQNKDYGLQLIKNACDRDYTNAFNTMGMILNEEKRYDESFPYHKRSAEKGDMHGLHNLGNAYFYARGVERDVKKAFDLWIEAAEKGNPDSYYTIGNIYYYGEYIEQDIPEAIKCFTHAANQACTTQELAIKRLIEIYRLLGDEVKANEWERNLENVHEETKMD
jgi:TPR repeat protein